VSKITVDIIVDMWLNEKGQMELFIGEDNKPVEMVPLIDLVRRVVDSHKVRLEDPLDWDDVKKINKLKKALLQCTAYLTQEIVNAK
jgi:hypothetical protein